MKAANGEGGIRKRPDGRWEARYSVEVGGVWRRSSVYGATRVEARQNLRKALENRDDGLVTVPATETVGKYFETWIAGAESTLRPRTVMSYRQIISTHIKPSLGSVPLARLRPQHIQAMYQELVETARAPKTIRNVHGVLHRGLEQAVRWRLLPSNPATLVDPPRRQPHEMQALSAEEAKLVLEAAKSDTDGLEAMWWLALTAGLRQGELVALRWPEVDLERGSVRVVASMIRVTGKGYELAEPKSRRSRRLVELGDGAAEVLRRHRKAQLETSLAAGRPVQRDGFVFPRATGQASAVTTLWKRWRSLLERAGVRIVRFHDARHTAATLLLSRGVHPKIVSEMLGHSTVAMTLDVYSHVTPAMHREAAKVMDDIFGG